MTDTLAAVRDILIPPRCASCGSAERWLCVACRDSFEPVRQAGSGCPVAGAGTYAGGLRDAIHRLKYRGEHGLAAELGDLIAARIAADLAAGVTIDVIVPVPLHATRRLERGYDQTLLLADAAARSAGLPLRDVLRRIRASASQVSLDRAARAGNVRGAFVAEVGALRGLRVALVDDVLTTGATLNAAASAARTGGAREIRGYVVAVDE